MSGCRANSACGCAAGYMPCSLAAVVSSVSASANMPDEGCRNPSSVGENKGLVAHGLALSLMITSV